jgi:hypothetical protein
MTGHEPPERPTLPGAVAGRRGDRGRGRSQSVRVRSAQRRAGFGWRIGSSWCFMLRSVRADSSSVRGTGSRSARAGRSGRHESEGFNVRATSEIRDELDGATARRTELWARLAPGATRRRPRRSSC